MELLKLLCASLSSVAVLFITAKLMGHKQVGQLDFFDYITGITIGSIAAELAIGEHVAWKPIVAILVYGVVAIVLSVAENKFPRSRKYINGSPVVIINNGKFCRENMKKAKLDLSEVGMMCRQAGYFDYSDIHTAIFESNGTLSILPISSKRPLTPKDIKYKPADQFVCREVIMDGRVVEENLKSLGVDAAWLEKRLKEQGYNDPKEIFLATCDINKQLNLFESD